MSPPPKKKLQNCFCQKFVKCLPTIIIFGTQIVCVRCTHFPPHRISVNALPCMCYDVKSVATKSVICSLESWAQWTIRTNILMVAGKLCADDIDECSLYPTRCRNGATCENTDGSYLCHCRHGYRGRFCDVNPNDCLPGPLSFLTIPPMLRVTLYVAVFVLASLCGYF